MRTYLLGLTLLAPMTGCYRFVRCGSSLPGTAVQVDCRSAEVFAHTMSDHPPRVRVTLVRVHAQCGIAVIDHDLTDLMRASLLFGPVEEPCGARTLRVNGWTDRGAWVRLDRR